MSPAQPSRLMQSRYANCISYAALVAGCALSSSLMVSPSIHAQTPAPAPANSGDDKNIPEWVKKQADNPIKWIIQQDNKNKPSKDEKPAKKAATKKPVRDEEVASPAPINPVSVRTPSVTNGTGTITRTAAPVTATPVAATPDTNTTANPNPAAAAATQTTSPAAEAGNTPELNAAAIPAPPPAETKPVEAPNPSNAAVAQVIDELIPISQPQPTLPREFLQSGAKSGRVVVNFIVNPDGNVSDVAITETSDRLLNRSVTNAVKQWIYKPISKPLPNRAEIAFQLD